ncbi:MULTISPECIES: hypothetical protein [Streptococcus]|nr:MULTISPECIES: hypothetical protein [Streptococcus]QBX22553.1 hypothetical protein Javan85_0056 [Streptococcus phage Javan85]QBX31880.1 hypothetical protein Javan84_0003 [Streptococcus phage Javan84]
MKAMKRILVMMILLPAGYIAFVLSPFLEIIEEEKNNDNSK